MPTIPISDAVRLAMAHHRASRLSSAEEIYREVLAKRAFDFDACHLLGVLLTQRHQFEEAEQLITRALSVRPLNAQAHCNLGTVYKEQKRYLEAIAGYTRAIRLQPNLAEAFNNLGNVYLVTGDLELAAEQYRKTIELKPHFGEAHGNLGSVLKKMGFVNEAIECFKKAISFSPERERPSAFNNLGVALALHGSLDEAEDCLEKAISENPAFGAAHSNLGNVLINQARHAESLHQYDQAAEATAKNPNYHSDRIFSLQFMPDMTAERLLIEAKTWNDRHAHQFENPPLRPRISGRRIRVGYLSPDFRDHCQSFFTVPLFSNHDRSEFEVYCYSDVPQPDPWTRRIQGCTDIWRGIERLSDAEVVARIQEDEIDILVDLTMHMGKNRLSIFARKPAPVQVTWLAYPGTTGLAAMDFRLSDPYLDPPREDINRCYSERTYRLPDSFWCYDPGPNTPSISRLPALSNGYVTFGCLNNFSKINEGVLSLWGRVLNDVKSAALILLAPNGRSRRWVLESFRAQGIKEERIRFTNRLSRSDYLSLYNQIDIGLDTFPYNGHTTSLDALWMGVPIITLVGTRVVGRGGLSQLTNLGLPKLITLTEENFVRAATSLALDLSSLVRLRESLRERMLNSPLMNGKRFASGVEAAYRGFVGI